MVPQGLNCGFIVVIALQDPGTPDSARCEWDLAQLSPDSAGINRKEALKIIVDLRPSGNFEIRAPMGRPRLLLGTVKGEQRRECNDRQ